VISRLANRGRDERGAVVVLVAMFSSAALGCAALAVDLGNVWQAQRQLHTATDAASLAAAQVYAKKGNGCATVAGAFLSSNDGAATPTACITGTGRAPSSGYVTVRAGKSVDFRFANGEADEGGSTSANWGIPAAATGLRPIVVCELFPPLATWLNAPVGPSEASDPLTVPFTNASLGCDNAPGNWNFLDYDGSSSGGADDLKDWFENGYPEPVPFPSMIDPQTGHVSSLASVLTGLVDSGEVFPVVLFDLVDGGGNNARYSAVAVVLVRLLDFRISGHPDDQYLTFEFQPGIVQGTCCGWGPDTGARVVAICAVNQDPTTEECGR
jgi:Flp pilus assembly protein TadG